MSNHDHTTRGPLPRRLFDRSRAVLREQGAAALWFKTLGELGYRRMTLFESQPGEQDYQAPDAPLELAWLTPAEVDRFCLFRRTTPRQLVLDRLSSGRRCLIARTQDEFVYATWLATENAWIDYLGVGLNLPANYVYQYEAYVHPRFRKRGYGSWIGRERRRMLADEGRSRTLAALMPENRAGEGLIRAAGFRQVGMLRRFKIGSVSQAWLSGAPGISIENLPVSRRL